MRLLLALALFVGGSTAQHSDPNVASQGRITTSSQSRPVSSVGYTGNPCSSNPCGPNTRCTVSKNNVAQCRCLEGYVPDGNTINGCKNQCDRHDDCPDNNRCQANRCVRVCVSGACGLNADCRPRNHAAQCTCPPGYNGDPHISCRKHVVESRTRPPAPYVGPCERNPCGINAVCKARGEQPTCSCPLGYEGNPLENCRRGECIENEDCPDHRVCQRLRCIDPCVGICGTGADCRTRNHQPVCSCPRGYTGDPMVNCRVFRSEEYCNPSPCGRNTNCKVANDRPVCSCIENYIGDPLNACRPECERDSDCGPSMGCSNNRCVNPCSKGACGEGAYCDVRNGRAVCSCPEFFLGNAHTRCYTECTEHNDCPSHQACIKYQCEDPCVGACGTGADCKVENHKPICSCPSTHTGHPYEFCREFTDADYCNPNPCGIGADCQLGHDRRGEKKAVCTCPHGFIGNALIACERGSCIDSSSCPDSQACYNFECANPCYVSSDQSVCGEDAYCTVKNHAPICSCPPGYTGNPLQHCYINDFDDDRRNYRQAAYSSSAYASDYGKR